MPLDEVLLGERRRGAVLVSGVLLKVATQVATLILNLSRKLVGTPRFELGTPCTPCMCATRLRHVPTRMCLERSHQARPRRESVMIPRFLTECGAISAAGP